MWKTLLCWRVSEELLLFAMSLSLVPSFKSLSFSVSDWEGILQYRVWIAGSDFTTCQYEHVGKKLIITYMDPYKVLTYVREWKVWWVVISENACKYTFQCKPHLTVECDGRRRVLHRGCVFECNQTGKSGRHEQGVRKSTSAKRQTSWHSLMSLETP